MGKIEGQERQQRGSGAASATRFARGRSIVRRLVARFRRPRGALVVGLVLSCAGLVGVAGAATITEFPILTVSSFPQGITAGPDGALWFTETSAGKIGRITTAGVITEFPLAPGSDPFDIATGPDGALWFTEFQGNKIGKLVPDPVWTEVPGGGLTPSSPAAVPYGSTLRLFVRGTDSRIYQNTQTGGLWSGWSEVPGGGLTPSQPVAVLGAFGFLHLFVQGIDNRIYENTRGFVDWIGWSEVPGGGLTHSGPAAVLDGSLLRLFVRGLDDRIYTTFLSAP